MRAIFQEKGKNKGKKYLKRVKKKGKIFKNLGKNHATEKYFEKKSRSVLVIIARNKLVVKGITIEIQQHCMKFVHS